ncbi:MAG: SDR family NAD(P)-dependent oxidoreductase [Acidimicrobiia bacterium]
MTKIDIDLDGHVIIVTGASKGIGLGIARHLADLGARLVVTARKPEALEALDAELTERGTPHLARQLNTSDRDGAVALAADVHAEFGRIDGLVANAQSFISVKPLEEVTERNMDLLFDTGPKGTLWGMQSVFPYMRDQGRGRIVTMGSNAAIMGGGGFGPYASSKEAIRGLTRVAAREWGPLGITVNCVCPVSVAHRAPAEGEEMDPVRAAMWAETFKNQPIPRDGSATDDIAPIVAFLLSDASRYMTGQTLMADGGAIMRP